MSKSQKTVRAKEEVWGLSDQHIKVLEDLVNNLNGTGQKVGGKGTGKLKSQRLLRSLADIVNTLDQTRNQLQTKVDEIAMVLEISQNLTEGLNINRIADIVIERAINYLQADSAALMLLEDDKRLSLIAAKGLSEHIPKDLQLLVGEGVAGWVAKTGEPVLLEAERLGDWDLLKSLNREKVKSCICVPLKYEGRAIGVIITTNVISERSFTQDNLQVLQIVSDIAALAIENLRLFRKSQSDFLNTVAALAAAIDAKDAYTRGHSERVAGYAVAIAAAMQLPQKDKTSIETAALLHDIGKIGIPDRILGKVETLTEKEFMVIKMHPYTGGQIIQPIEMLTDVMPLVVAHHERFDGTGYLKGAKGKEIPLGSRIISVADAFEAMTSERPHRSALDVKKATEELQEKAGTQFDPEVVDVFLRVLKSQKTSRK